MCLGSLRSGYICLISFFDEHSRKKWIYLIHYKDKVFDIFKKFRTLILRTDCGDEYTYNFV